MLSSSSISQTLNRQLNIISAQIANYMRIKLYYSPQNSSDIYTLDLCFRVSYGYKKSVLLGDFVQDVCNSVISPFLSVQNSNITWNYVSIMYPRNKVNQNILNIPLRGIYGQIIQDSNDIAPKSGVLHFSMRYKGSAMASVKKLMGVGSYYLNPESYTHQSCIDVIDQCEKIFYQPIELNRSQVNICFVREAINKGKESSLKSSKKNSVTTKVKSQKIYKKPIFVTALPA